MSLLAWPACVCARVTDVCARAFLVCGRRASERHSRADCCKDASARARKQAACIKTPARWGGNCPRCSEAHTHTHAHDNGLTAHQRERAHTHTHQHMDVRRAKRAGPAPKTSATRALIKGRRNKRRPLLLLLLLLCNAMRPWGHYDAIMHMYFGRQLISRRRCCCCAGGPTNEANAHWTHHRLADSQQQQRRSSCLRSKAAPHSGPQRDALVVVAKSNAIKRHCNDARTASQPQQKQRCQTAAAAAATRNNQTRNQWATTTTTTTRTPPQLST